MLIKFITSGSHLETNDFFDGLKKQKLTSLNFRHILSLEKDYKLNLSTPMSTPAIH